MSKCKCNVIGHSPLGFFRTNENNDTDKYSNKHNNFTNPNWREADHLAVYRRSREVELGVTENNSRRSEWDLNMLNPRSNHSATLLPGQTQGRQGKGRGKRKTEISKLRVNGRKKQGCCAHCPTHS